MRRPVPALAVVLSLGFSCTTDPRDDILTGDWGGRGLAVTANSTGVRVRMPCRTVGDHAAPVPLGSDGAFEFETTMRSFYGDFEVYLEGRISGRQLLVELSTEYSRPPAETFTLLKGVAPDFTEYVCLGANP